MIKTAVFDTRPYDREWFTRELRDEDGVSLRFYENKLSAETAVLANGCKAVCAFVNDNVDEKAIDALCAEGVELLAMRCAGYNNVDLKAAKDRLTVVRVPQYSPHAVAEHAMALLLTLNRKTHKAYIRTRDYNFSLIDLTGFDLYGRTAGVIGTGRIGRAFIDICRGFGMNIVAYDPQPAPNADYEYTDIDELCRRADVISLHCPLTPESKHIINDRTIRLMKSDAIIVNTSRGELLDSEALLRALRTRRIGGACLDVYEEESDVFFDDCSASVSRDETLSMLLALPNVIVSSHQAFLTQEALGAIARTTLDNIRLFFEGTTVNQVL